ncbi:asparagine synthase (glutamine-hydrolyzing) [Candidatus Kaiserbacteria bacterium RIFCSPHIGHO2_01_FULL_50_13]|uniref:asparagine synthase (glutamine-hydrolyzing) n=1 Tax=Candidatus Kaiserbacteria bacterium RIFCSPLOWO2_01_FULL_50_24 TaxID=1798507 RepID=A0A1F6EIW6_9BACT|nr:MAG: asparagine synthase (glutamine-hydrolyzing) [Candidatus Kaiserbacteria bacterium RIFCSPHIGHO2_01_FULL_50_13]OGG73579.1 MAG: asparagine synthase (glutamine-hydrolyzing) [Candidatus Kaiserbacteria bacterium RIFCSPLOWO2_01_FULL_50_24]OGG82202.1 MAG: asparagine synthase (glutamine-hydrolyzing) [Candidatus Kaiserbacteria bacterium RIFCSPLOWO2_02_FULL_51_13]
MCGIIGMVGGERDNRNTAIHKAVSTLVRRGPDDKGVTDFSKATLGHTRLSIIDLTTGAQPMKDNRHDMAITFNGEIYNYKKLRVRLEQKGHSFSTTSDTEVILKSYSEYGDKCPEYLDGQFTFAIWDNEKERLFMARDRFGEKPLFYHYQGPALIFASEIKALLATGLVNNTLDRTSLDNYLALYFIPPWRSMYRDITPLLPAHRAVFQNGKLTIERYWKLTHETNSVSYDDAAARVRELLAESVKSRMVADVEVGVFLSGGIDSSIVTALAQRAADRPLKSFSAGFDEHINELPYARKIAAHVGTDHYERNVPVLLDDIRAVTRYYDEPLGDSSNVPTALISKFARGPVRGSASNGVKVVLSGDGGDELFFGYGHYRAHWHLPKVKKLLALVLGFSPDALYKRSHLNMFSPHERAHLWKDRGAVESDPTKYVDLSEAKTSLQKINLLDIYLKLPGDMLTKVDRSSMMHSLEVRSPFLNHELAQFAFNLPDDYKTDRGRGKLILQKACGDLLPENVFTRKKQGFGAPVRHWLKEDPVRALMNEMFKDPRSAAIFNADVMRSYINDFYSGNSALSYKIWMLFTLELWMREHDGAYSF